MAGKQAILIRFMSEAVYLSVKQDKKIDVKSSFDSARVEFEIMQSSNTSQKGIHALREHWQICMLYYLR